MLPVYICTILLILYFSLPFSKYVFQEVAYEGFDHIICVVSLHVCMG